MGSVIRLGLETVHGTVAGSFTTVPCSFTGKLRQKNTIPSEARAGQDVNFSVIPGLRNEEWEVNESPIYHDTFGLFLAMAFGTPTKVVVDTIFDNTFKLADDPKSASIQWNQPHRSVQPFQTLYNVVDELTIAFDVNGDLTFEASGVSMSESNVAAPSYSFSTARPFPGWACAVTKAGAGYTKLLKGKIKVKRNRKAWRSFNNSQEPTKMTIGDRTVEFDLVVDFDATTDYAEWKAAGTTALQLVFEDAGVVIGSASKPTLTLKMGTIAAEEDEIDVESDLPSLKIKGFALYNSTDLSKIVAILRSSRDYTA